MLSALYRKTLSANLLIARGEDSETRVSGWPRQAGGRRSGSSPRNQNSSYPVFFNTVGHF